MNNLYFNQVNLLLELLPFALENKDFALKGGTAINLFFRDMNRLSVDIDLCYLPLKEREETLQNIEIELKQISKRIKSAIKDVSVETKYTSTKEAKNILIRHNNSIVKIEINLVVRGALFPCILQSTQSKIKEIFNKEVIVQCLSFADVYGGKICACLDRQHPRDWYDVWVLLQNEGLTEEIKKAFLLYLLSSRRPMAEILDPFPVDQRILYTNELEGMSSSIPSYTELSQIRIKTTKLILEMLSENEKEFLLTFKKGNPSWEKSGISNAKDFPAVKWKLFNIQKMSEEKRQASYNKLKRVINF